LSNDKKDLTRIEDLAEYLHELQEADSTEADVPDLPFENSEGTESSFDFNASEETPEPNHFGEIETVEPESDENIFETSFETSEENSSALFAEAPDESPNESSPFESSEDTSPFTLSEGALEEEEDIFNDNPTEKKNDAYESSFATETPLPLSYTLAETKEFKAPETFEDVKKFAESTSFTGMSAEGNPSFSVLLKNVRFIEDVNDILRLLNDLGLMADTEEQTKNRLLRGSLLIPRISEFAAIFLAHKLRRFDIDIQVGLSDEIHPPKHKEQPETGVVSKFNLYQNQAHYFHFDDPKLEISQIIVSATQSLEGYQVVRYLGVASEHKILDGHVVEDEGSTEIPRHYQELATKLKAHALKVSSNAVVGLNYQLTPLPSEFGMNSTKYRLSCTGNLVWVNKL
jgi:uncharacterized protein YbjQ (UPF0145 family)